jgi:hypothetical protein
MTYLLVDLFGIALLIAGLVMAFGLALTVMFTTFHFA